MTDQIADLPDAVTVGEMTYKLRRFTPKRRGEPAGHGWVREVGRFPSGDAQRSEVSSEGLQLVDEIVRLRAEVARLSSVDGAALIAAERRRQIEEEGWTAEHDAEHVGGVLGMAASGYLWAAQLADSMDASDMTPGDWEKWCPDYWPWRLADWKPSNDPIRNLVRAGALVAAELDRVIAEESRG